MIILCEKAHQDPLMQFLKRDPIYHTFIISDILHYGFDKPFQQIYMQVSPEGDCAGVFLRYYHNLIVAGEGQNADFPTLWKMVGRQVNTVMGKAETVQALQQACGLADRRFVEKDLYMLADDSKLLEPTQEIRWATPEDVDKIHAFLMEIPEFQTMYAEKGMIENRIKEGDGIHLYFTRHGKITAHANSSAKTQFTCMVGGVAVRAEERGQGLGHLIVSELCRRVLNSGQVPCLFSDYPPNRSLFCNLGFQKAGIWGVLEQT